ncbi:HIRA-interacting protein 5 [Daldinia caldariorum]|uniref:HIRA-interacting protein 5 n=1 Tax=Daldinia caldariorum TaxID=326644 RepID=UPI0020076567|nr:HIRA-interacting protein 5 [Daldinia caldariorum]KAI1471401.1 HIRA-interacting protein 5 [Daldinia caldariorum]
MPSNRIFRPAVNLLSATTRRVRPATCSRLYEAARHAHTSSQALGVSARLRPTLQTASRLSAVAPRGARSIFIQTETTPNPDALKFLPNYRVLPPEIPTTFIEYLNPRSTIAPPYPSPLAAQLMNIDGVTSVFYGPDFITVTKSPDANWVHVRPEVFSLITEAITAGQQIVNVSSNESGEQGQEAAEEDSLSYNENDSEVVGMIKELLETRIRPAIQEDGGDIEFRGFEDGYVKLKLRGACRTCDSSTVTLKNGIEGMLMHYIEEVKGVHQIMDQEEEIAMKEFAKFEEKLRAQKGPDAAPSTPGKDSLDSVPG